MKRRYVVFSLMLAVLYTGCIQDELESAVHQGIYPVYNGDDLLGDSYPYTFVYFGDTRPETVNEKPEIFMDMIPLIHDEHPLFIVGGGDFVVDGTPEDFEEFLTVVSDFEAPLFYVCGNHDDSAYYEEYLGERVYALTYKNALFIVLDNSKKVLHDNQLTFLEEQLKKPYEHTFVFMHIPPFDPEGAYSMLNPEAFMDLIFTYEVDYVICSHIHHFYEEKRNNTVFIISGGGGSPLRRMGYHHYVVIKVGDTITHEVVRL